MGMFDDIRCDYPLPGGTPKFGNNFQTKDLDCELKHYVITEDGRLMHGDTAEDITGVINFYNSNASGGWGEVRYTDKGEDYESADFRATFVSGKLTDIVSTSRETGPAIAYERRVELPSAERMAVWQARIAESFLGKPMYLLFGGKKDPSQGDWTVVVYENKDCLVVESAADQDLRVCERRLFIDRLLFESYESAVAYHQGRLDEYDAEVRRYREHLAARSS